MGAAASPGGTPVGRAAAGTPGACRGLAPGSSCRGTRGCAAADPCGHSVGGVSAGPTLGTTGGCGHPSHPEGAERMADSPTALQGMGTESPRGPLSFTVGPKGSSRRGTKDVGRAPTAGAVPSPVPVPRPGSPPISYKRLWWCSPVTQQLWGLWLNPRAPALTHTGSAAQRGLSAPTAGKKRSPGGSTGRFLAEPFPINPEEGSGVPVPAAAAAPVVSRGSSGRFGDRRGHTARERTEPFILGTHWTEGLHGGGKVAAQSLVDIRESPLWLSLLCCPHGARPYGPNGPSDPDSPHVWSQTVPGDPNGLNCPYGPNASRWSQWPSMAMGTAGATAPGRRDWKPKQ